METIYPSSARQFTTRTSSHFVVTPNPDVCHSRWWQSEKQLERLSSACSLLPVAMWPIDPCLGCSLTAIAAFRLRLEFFRKLKSGDCVWKLKIVVLLLRYRREGTPWNRHIKASVMVECYIKVPTLLTPRSSLWHLQITHLLNTHCPVWKES